MSNETSGGGCGCVGLIIGVLVLWATAFGVQTPWGPININIFPPGIIDAYTGWEWWGPRMKFVGFLAACAGAIGTLFYFVRKA